MVAILPSSPSGMKGTVGVCGGRSKKEKCPASGVYCYRRCCQHPTSGLSAMVHFSESSRESCEMFIECSKSARFRNTSIGRMSLFWNNFGPTQSCLRFESAELCRIDEEVAATSPKQPEKEISLASHLKHRRRGGSRILFHGCFAAHGQDPA